VLGGVPRRGIFLIAGRSKSVFVGKNLIQGGRFNGITLGSYTVLDANGDDSTVIIGIGTEPGDPCCDDGSLNPPVVVIGGGPGSTIVTGGPLQSYLSDGSVRNRTDRALRPRQDARDHLDRESPHHQ
jgi:hypothetical protein